MEEKKRIRILFVDDDEDDYFITNDLISDIKNQEYSIHWISNYNEALKEVEKDTYDIFLVDYNLGAKTGIDLISEINKKNNRVPSILLTGQGDHEIDVLAMKKGASDYLVKGKIDADLLERSIRYAIEKKVIENRILYLAYYDQLTDMPNRIFFLEQLNYALAHAKRYNRILAILFLDLDNFKLINDSMGHNIGDLLLKEAAKRLCACIRKSDIIARNNQKTFIDTVARLGGDEFTISLTEIHSFQDASLVANRIIESINKPFKIEDHDIFTGVSIGISLFPSDADDADTLIKYADNAMYHVKKSGKNSFNYYQKSMNNDVMDRISMISSIRKGMDQDEFLLYFQPEMNLKSGKIIGFEALLRWNRYEKGIILPGDFIPFAEEHNLISFITDWVIHRVCKHLCEWQEKKLKILPVSINLPVNQFEKPDFVEYLIKIIQSYRLSAELFELEVTESIFMKNMDTTNLKLMELRAQGFRISIDDFGTGFSSLNRLKEVPCNILKIDKSFIRYIDKNTPDTVIIRSVIDMAHGLQMEVLAEGVETIRQFNFLKQNNCDSMQGFLLSHPLPDEEIPGLLDGEIKGNGIGVQLLKKIIDNS